MDLIGDIVADEGLECDFERRGHLNVASKRSHYERMVGHVEWMKNELGHELRLVPKEDLRSEIGSDAFFGGVVDELSAGLDPAKYVFGMAVAVAKHGAVLCERTAVKSLTAGAHGFFVGTNEGVVRAKEVVVATNGYTGTLVRKVRRHVFPVGSYIVVTERLPQELQRKLSPNGRMFYDSNYFLNYFRLTPDGRMLFGGRNDLSTDLDLTVSAERLGKRMVDVFPELEDVAITHSWTGKLGITFDLMPHFGRMDGVHYVVGFGGHGVPFATYLGREMGLFLLGEKNSSPFAEIKQRTMFFYRKRPWFVPLVSAYFRLLDWVS